VRMKYKLMILAVLLSPVWVKAQKALSELSLLYNYTTSNTAEAGKDIKATAAFFLKGNLSRSDISSSLFTSTTIYDAQAGSGVILKEINGQKLLIRMNEQNWKDKNARYGAIHYADVPETRMIAGYSCTKATATTRDGYSITVIYTRDLLPQNKAYDPPFENLPGLPLEYSFSKGNLRITYVLASINLNPVPASKFDIPTSGYRELTYDESRKGR